MCGVDLGQRRPIMAAVSHSPRRRLEASDTCCLGVISLGHSCPAASNGWTGQSQPIWAVKPNVEAAQTSL